MHLLTQKPLLSLEGPQEETKIEKGCMLCLQALQRLRSLCLETETNQKGDSKVKGDRRGDNKVKGDRRKRYKEKKMAHGGGDRRGYRK